MSLRLTSLTKRLFFAVLAMAALLCTSLSFAAPIHIKCGSGESASQWTFFIDADGKKISRGDLPKYEQVYDENFRVEDRFYYAEGQQQDSTGAWAPAKIWVDRIDRTVRESRYESFSSKWYESRYDRCMPYTPGTKAQF